MRMYQAIACAILISLGGCGKNADKQAPQAATQKTAGWQTIQYDEGGEDARFLVTIWTPCYGTPAGGPDTITIRWDGKQIFAGKLPSRLDGPTGMPFDLIEIQCKPGKHTLFVEHGTQSQTETVNFDSVRTRHFGLFGFGEGKLIQDLGPSPQFALGVHRRVAAQT